MKDEFDIIILENDWFHWLPDELNNNRVRCEPHLWTRKVYNMDTGLACCTFEVECWYTKSDGKNDFKKVKKKIFEIVNKAKKLLVIKGLEWVKIKY